MESVLGRYRNLIVLVGVLFVQVLGLAVQVKRTTDNDSTRLIRIWAVGMVTPLEKALVWTQTSTANIWHNYFYLRGVRAENRSLRAQIEQMRLEQVRMSQDADQARRLQALLGFKEQFISQTMAAQVIGGSGSDLSRLVYIDKGYSDGIRPDMAVITGDGIVGKVLRADRADRHVAQVLLINDQTSGVGAILDKTRLQGILRGTPAGEVVLEKVMSDETVPAEEQVLTSGGDGIFPKGLLIGKVSSVKQGSDLFLNIHIRPAADLSKLEEVLVVTKIDERQTEPDQKGAARAVDILAERLPTVPPKPESAGKDAGTGTASPTATPKALAPQGSLPKTSVPKTSEPKTSEPKTSASAASDARTKPASGDPSVNGGAPVIRKTSGSATSAVASSASSSTTSLKAKTAPAGSEATRLSPKSVNAAVPAALPPQATAPDSPH
jgi:rod shape-determining protein MreC